MSANQFQIEQFDHVELFVPDQYEAAAWYRHLFGLQIIGEFEFWADDGGPLMIGDASGRTKLALFRGDPPGFGEPVGFQRVAFRATGEEFLQFLTWVKEAAVYNHKGEPVNRLDPVDHQRAYSVYFYDPYGHRYEVTTYDYDLVSSRYRSPEHNP